jgi:hypothetical protein
MFGDVNADAKIGVADAVQLQRFLLGQDGDLGNWKNADLITDETIDVFDFIKLRKVLAGEEDPEGAKLTVKVVDMMTGEPIDGASVTLHSEYDYNNETHLFTLGDWTTGEDDINLFGLPTDDAYKYLLEVSGLPDDYGHTFGCWDGCQEFFFGEDNEDKELVVRILRDGTECDLTADFFDWSMMESRLGVGNMEITDKEGNIYYQRLFGDKFALPDGEYHAKINIFDYPYQAIDPDGEFADEVREIFPDEVFRDWTSGIDFTVKDGKIDNDLRIDLGPKDGMDNGVKVSCYDVVTGEPISGAKLSLIQFPDTDPKLMKEWTSSADEPEVIDGLVFSGANVYKVQVDGAPEGYTGSGQEYLGWGNLSGYMHDVRFYFAPDTAEKSVVINILNADEGNALFNDLCTLDIYSVDGPSIGKAASGIKAGEGIILPDGDYIVSLDVVAMNKKGYRCIDDILGAEFSVVNGRTDAPVELHVSSADKGLDDLEELLGGLGDLSDLGDLEGLKDLF